jgi:hypothetical protein
VNENTSDVETIISGGLRFAVPDTWPEDGGGLVVKCTSYALLHLIVKYMIQDHNRLNDTHHDYPNAYFTNYFTPEMQTVRLQPNVVGPLQDLQFSSYFFLKK